MVRSVGVEETSDPDSVLCVTCFIGRGRSSAILDRFCRSAHGFDSVGAMALSYLFLELLKRRRVTICAHRRRSEGREGTSVVSHLSAIIDSGW